jgi:SAM-dependent methyltransferase
MKDAVQLRQTFDQVAQLYNEVRPRYPEALFSTLIKVAGLSLKSKLVEIGPGTGQATKPLAIYGYDIIAVELGAALSDVAMHELKDFENVRIVTDSFENIKLSNDTFDLVYAATSLHWIKLGSRYSKPYRILKDRGYLAIIHTNHISDGQGDVFFEASQPIYERYNFTEKNGKQSLPKLEAIKPAEIDERLFRLVHFQLFPMIISYSAKEYIKLLNTYSDHIALLQQNKDDFFDQIENLINDKFNGSIRNHIAISLTIAQKV